MIAFLEDVPSGTLLELGCGPGLMVSDIRQRGFEYYGLDISSGMIRECRRRHGHDGSTHFLVGDLQRLAFPDSTFDTVVCMGALEYVPNEGLALDEIRRVIRPDGVAIISASNKWSPYNAWARLLYRRLTGHGPKEIVREYRSLRSFKPLLARHGLDVIKASFFAPTIFLSPLDELFPSQAVATSDVLERLGGTMQQKLGTGFLVKCKPHQLS